jgi:predicted enzyme related to lactoylglutathione lyase
MPQRSGYDPGTPCWVDLGTPDVETSINFCADLFGWSADTVTDEAGNHIYTMLSKDGRYVAGLGGQPPGMEGAPPIWSTYICVADAAHTCSLIEKAGGQVVMPAMQVFDSGWMAVATDPTGVFFRLWQPLEHKGAGVVNEPDTYSWNELISSDVERAKQFYADVFGWSYDGMDMGHGTYWVVQGGESGGIAGLMSRPPGMPDAAPDHWEVYFMVADIRAKMDAVVGQGGQVLFGPESIPGVGQIGTVMHPAGGVFSLMQPPG